MKKALIIVCLFYYCVDASELFFLKYGSTCFPFFIEWCIKNPEKFPLITLHHNLKQQTICASAPLLKILAQSPSSDDSLYREAVLYGCALLRQNDECDDIIIHAARYKNSLIIEGLCSQNQVYVKDFFTVFTELLKIYDGLVVSEEFLTAAIELTLKHNKNCDDIDYAFWCVNNKLYHACLMCVDKGLIHNKHNEVFRCLVEQEAVTHALRIVENACKQGMYLDDFLDVVQKELRKKLYRSKKLQNFLNDLCLQQGKIKNINEIAQELYSQNHDQALHNLIQTQKAKHSTLIKFCMRMECIEQFLSSFCDVNFSTIPWYKEFIFYVLRKKYNLFRMNKKFCCDLIHHCVVSKDNLDELLVKALASGNYSIAYTLFLCGAHIPEHDVDKVVRCACVLDSSVVSLLIQYGYACVKESTGSELFDQEKLYFTRSLGVVELAGHKLGENNSNNLFIRCAVDCWYALQGQYKIIDRINSILKLFPNKNTQRRIWHFILVTICNENYDYAMYQVLKKSAFFNSKCTWGTLVASMHSSNFKRLFTCVKEYATNKKQLLLQELLRCRYEQYDDALAKCMIHQWNVPLYRFLRDTAFSDVTCICSR